MRIKYVISFVLALIFLSAQAFSVDLRVNFTDIAPAIINRNYSSNTPVGVMNLSFITNESQTNLTSLNISIIGSVVNGTCGNISSIYVKEGDMIVGTFDNLSNVSQENNSIVIKINGTSGIVINSVNKTNLTLYFNLSDHATTGVDFGANITSNESISTSNQSDTINGTFPMSTSLTKIANLHVVASLRPNYADTNVTNQTITYLISLLSGTDNVNRTSIVVPSEYHVENVTSVKTGTAQKTIDYNSNCPASSGVQTDHACVEVGQTINITLPGSGADSSQNNTIEVKILVDTPAIGASGNITSTVEDGSGVNLVENSTYYGRNVTLTAKQLVEVKNITAIKNSAFANGNDYWEFNITLNITENVNGTLQMRMNNWTNSNGDKIPLTSGTSNYAMIYKNGHIDENATVKTSYTSSGISYANVHGKQNVILRMIIPSDAPQSSDNWWTKFWMIFRTE